MQAKLVVWADINAALDYARRKYDEAHDDKHTGGTLAECAARVAVPSFGLAAGVLDGCDRHSWQAIEADRIKRSNTRRQQLVRAAAMLVHEIQRIDRGVAEAERRLTEMPPKCPKCGQLMGKQTNPDDGSWWCGGVKCGYHMNADGTQAEN